MKIIKQNDSSGGLIFKQNMDGKAMKQNYNFGNGFWKSGTNNVYIELPQDIINAYSDDWTIMAYIDDGGVNNALFTVRDNLGASVQYAGTYASLNYFFFKNGSITTITDNSKNNLCGLRKLGDNIFLFANSESSAIPDDIQSNNPPYTIFAGVTFSDTGQAYQRGHFVRSKIDDFMVYKRYISDAEISFIYNNRLGNEPLSTNMLSVRYTFEQFGIKSFNGVDAVCAVDVSGNENHGKLIGLPAGDLNTQLAWANLNCLKR